MKFLLNNVLTELKLLKNQVFDRCILQNHSFILIFKSIQKVAERELKFFLFMCFFKTILIIFFISHYNLSFFYYRLGFLVLVPSDQENH